MAFQNKVVLITGASSGIGASCAVNFAKEGALLALVGRDQEKFCKVVEKIKNSGVTTEPLVILADVTTESKRIIDETIRKYQRLDVLINNAGFAQPGSIETATIESYDAIMNTNARAAFQLTQLAAPHLIESKGNIVNVSSVGGLRAFPGFLAYCMSKAALDQFTRCLALELAPKGVRVNAVNPGVIASNLHKNLGMSEEAYKEDLEKASSVYPVRRVGEIDEVAGAIIYLASQKASFVTGACLPIDGGISNSSPR